MERPVGIGLSWRLRRIAAGFRQQDVARKTGISVSRYSSFERGDAVPTALDRRLIEAVLPPLPDLGEDEDSYS
jgi:transcriptional regulator with XRE-family HTH domain